MIIRSAGIKDFDNIYLLLQQLWPDKKLNKNNLMVIFSRGIDSQNDLYFCAELNGKVIGFCSLAFKNSLWQEEYIGYKGKRLQKNRVTIKKMLDNLAVAGVY